MKFGQPLLTTELSGSIGGATASSSRGGIGYFRVRRVPSNPRTYAQSIVRLATASLAAAWRGTLTALQRASWESIAGSSGSGINAYVKGNIQGALNGEAAVATAPASATLTVTPLVSCIVDASAHTITFSGDMGTIDNVRGNVYTTPPQSASRASRQFPYRLSGFIPGDEAALTLDVADPAYPAVAGQVVYVRLVRYGQSAGDFEGEVAEAQEFRCIVVA